MNVADALFLALLAFADIALIIHLRQRRGRQRRAQRMMRSLALAVRQEVAIAAQNRDRRPMLRRAC
jgi:hypothetical protein